MAILTPLPLFVLSFGVLLVILKLSKKRLPLPPGPAGDPLIGHLRLLHSADDKELTFYELGKKYGGIIHLTCLGRRFILLNDLQMAIDLLEKRGSNYSGRPMFPLHESAGFIQATALMDYGSDHQLHRKMLQKYFNKNKASLHRPIQAQEARELVRNLTLKPENRQELLIRFATAIVIRISYGHVIEAEDDPYLKIMNDIVHHVLPVIGPPEGSVVDLFPFLRYFPSWFPGAHDAHLARSTRPFVERLYRYPVIDIKEQMRLGTARPSFLAAQLEEIQSGEANRAMTIEHIQGVSAVLYLAGTDTIASSLSTFFLAMVLHPECQAKAQQEIDAVIGSNRLPDFSDRGSLPYIEFILQETLRWHPAVPLGIPHTSREDDTYNGMFIPKGSIVVAHTRGMALNEEVYQEPFQFNPDRFIPEPAGRGEPYLTGSFGFGRRICPGRFLAEDSLWIAIATTLAVLSVSKEIGDDGQEIIPEEKFKLEATSQPHPYRCRIQPRNEVVRLLIA